jgi:S1-C subfamily serine protease
MRSLGKLLAVVLTLGSFVAALCQEQDLRDRFGTRSLDAAKQIAQAIELSKAKQYKQALAAAEAAIKADDHSQMAYYWKANILANLGDVPASIAAYQKCIAGELARSRRVSGSAASKLGVLFGKLNQLDESDIYFTKAILADYDNASGTRANAYRNLAVNAEQRGQNLAAALALSYALEDKAKNVTEERILQLFKKGQDQESARVLHFPEKPAVLSRRQQATRLAPVSLGEEIPELLAELWPAPDGGYVIAVPPDARHYYLISTNPKIAVRKLKADGPIVSTCLVAGRLYAVASDPARIDVIIPETGSVASTYPLKARPPRSLAVFPARSRAYFPDGGVVSELNLTTGNVTKSKVPAEVVAGHPNQRFVFSYVKDSRSRWLPCALMKAVATPAGLLTAEIRENAAANGWRMSVSPDGNWAAIAGGGGWRPVNNQADGGYGVAVFSAWNFEHWQGFFATDAYPQGVCFNPVTSQVAVIRENDAAVYHLADSKSSARVKGPFSGAAAWSGDGRYLCLGGSKKGLSCWSNALDDHETKFAGNWWKSIKVAAPSPVTRAAPTFAIVTAVQDFQLAEPSRQRLAQEFETALKKGGAAKPPAWREYAPYFKDDEARRVIRGAAESLKNKDDFGITIFQVKTALKTYPKSSPLLYFLAEALRQGNQPEEAASSYLDAVHADAGRTDLSCQALNQLAALLSAQGKDSSALHCMTTSLGLDRANPHSLEIARGLLKKLGLASQAEQLAKTLAELPHAPADRPAELPKLAKEPTPSRKPGAAELIRASVASVVYVKAADRFGSGVCIGSPDAILTNGHVVEGSDAVDVYPFAYKGAALVRLPKLTAKVLFQSTEHDLAVLKLDTVSADLHPLPVAERSPEVGERVYSIGSPGLGGAVLEQSVSEGIISAANRVIDGKAYLQHTAAINPGNSGGPLIDEWGRLAGIVTLKTKLENVGFAVPVEIVRTVFKSP